MEKYKIKTVNACYTGGGIYIYWGTLENGAYFRACDDWDLIWICDDDTSLENDDANFPEFYEEHTIEEIYNNDFIAFWNIMLSRLIESNENGNYSREELKNRIIK